jgi:FixJ family two-component response regulator
LWAAFVRDVADQRAVMEDVVFMSGYAPNLVEGAHASDEPLRFIQKPFTMAELARSVESALRAGAQRPRG